LHDHLHKFELNASTHPITQTHMNTRLQLFHQKQVKFETEW